MGHSLHCYETALVSFTTLVYAMLQTFMSKDITEGLLSGMRAPNRGKTYSCREYKPSSIVASSTSIAAGWLVAAMFRKSFNEFV